VALHDLAHPGRIRRRRAAGGYGHFPKNFDPRTPRARKQSIFAIACVSLTNPWTTPRGMKRSSPGLISMRLPATVQVVRDRHTGVWRDRHLIHIKRPAGIKLGAQKPQLLAPALMSSAIVVAFRYAIEKIAGRVSSSIPNYQESLWPDLRHVYWGLRSVINGSVALQLYGDSSAKHAVDQSLPRYAI